MSSSRLLQFIVASLLGLLLGAGAAQSKSSSNWVTTWAAAPASAGPPLGPQTIRQVVRTSIGGSSLRIRLSNLFGTAPVTFGPVHVAVHAAGSAIRPETDHAVTFGGKSTVTVKKGADVVSDPVAMPVTALQELAVSVYLPARTGASTVHEMGMQTAYLAVSGDHTGDASLAADETAASRYFLTDVEVTAAPGAAAVVAFGDSITDGYGSTRDKSARWPDYLAARLQADPSLAAVAVVNAGISGNRLLNDGAGPRALSRFERDALDKPGVRLVVLLEGINDIGQSTTPATSRDDVSAAQIIDAMKSLISRAHAKGVKIWGATLTPFGGVPWPYHSPAGEDKRREVNAWIRSSGAFDAVVDFDVATRDNGAMDRFLPAFDSGDHLHPDDAGYQGMAAAIPW